MLGNFRARRAYFSHVRGKTVKARTMYEAAFRAGCDSARYYSSYGVLLMNERDFERALAHFKKTLERFEGNPHFKPRKNAKGKLVSNPKYRTADRANLKINCATALWKTGETQAAADLLLEVYRTFKNVSLYGSLGYMLIALGDITGDYSEAERINAEALDYESEDAVIQDNLGQLRYRLGDLEGAKTHLEKALSLKPRQVDSLYYLARVLHDQGDLPGAVETMELALKETFRPLSTVTREEAEALMTTWKNEEAEA